MATKVLSSQGSCSCDGDGGVPGIQPTTIDQIIVRSKSGILNGNIINEYNENGKKVYELDDFTLVKPVVNISNNAPAIVEVGDTVDTVTFSGSIAQGTYPIETRSIAPDPGGLDLSSPFTFDVSNVKRTTPGIAQLHTLTAEDDQGNETVKTSGVIFKDAYYQGFSALSVLDETQIKALANKSLIDSILAGYQGLKTYVIPGPDPKHIYWCGPINTSLIGSAMLNGFALPLVDVGPIEVVNDHDSNLALFYYVKRTANKLDPGTHQILLM